MRYAAIYERFIQQRCSRQHCLTGYVERHHIVPRSIGGTDDSDNLIRLTPEDHFFAHLLLAKIHGGRLWAPIAFMVGGNRHHWQARHSRRSYGWAVRAMARANSGAGAYQFDHQVHRLEHVDGRSWVGTQFAMNAELGLHRSLANMLVKSRVASAHGWFRRGERPEFVGRGTISKHRHPMERREVHTFVHVDGRRFVGTQRELTEQWKVSKPCACRLARGKQRVASGWFIEGLPPHSVGRGAKLA